ncbi:MAG: outer membrane protein assembly factor BamE [Bacteroidales bacterium]|nr:outer membrane protein assembly factor BamE [Bacteroidales bacterium]
MKKYILITLLGLISSLYSCSQEKNTMKNKTYNAEIEYPYSASKQRKNIILDNMNKLKPGMNENDVVQILTLPDEINATYPLYITVKDTTGFSYIYIIKRKHELDSRLEPNDKSIAIHFDLNKTLISAYAIGIPEFNAIMPQSANTELLGSRITTDEAIKKSMIIPISETQKIIYQKPIIAVCVATENPPEPLQVLIEHCYYYHKFEVKEIISGEIINEFEGDYNTYIPNNEQCIQKDKPYIMILGEIKAEGAYHIVKVLNDTETNREKIKSSINKLSYLIKKK